jgi:ubiquinone/menaquinone biosynthesis C-methylase UbiE
MIENAIINFKKWGIDGVTKTMVCSAEDIPINQPTFQVITCFNNVANFFIPQAKRNSVFKKFYNITSEKGVLIGMVHNLFGTPQKTFFFLLQKLFAPFSKYELGDRVAGRKKQKYIAHYFSKKELMILLKNAGYRNIEILSLEQLYKLRGKKYNRLKGSNNLLFFAGK